MSKIPLKTMKTQQILRRAVREELERKSKLGQYAIVARHGKPCRIKASELLKELKKAAVQKT
mgnify:CR=1 FL=1